MEVALSDLGVKLDRLEYGWCGPLQQWQ
uniref:Uncharacterized protein n=1 Tax=Anguilla anguilla TaxID=7936 RepID=A0A0E9SAQ3_ANGAN